MARRRRNDDSPHRVPDDAGWRPYGPGKYDSMADSFLHAAAGDGVDEELGESEGFGWYGLMEGDILASAERGAADLGDELTPEERRELKRTKAVILSENSQGFVGVEYYTSLKKARAEWKKVERDYDEFVAEGDDDEGDEY